MAKKCEKMAKKRHKMAIKWQQNGKKKTKKNTKQT